MKEYLYSRLQCNVFQFEWLQVNGETWIIYSLVAHTMLFVLRILLKDTLLKKNSHFIVSSSIKWLQIGLTKEKNTSKKLCFEEEYIIPGLLLKLSKF